MVAARQVRVEYRTVRSAGILLASDARHQPGTHRVTTHENHPTPANPLRPAADPWRGSVASGPLGRYALVYRSTWTAVLCPSRRGNSTSSTSHRSVAGVLEIFRRRQPYAKSSKCELECGSRSSDYWATDSPRMACPWPTQGAVRSGVGYAHVVYRAAPLDWAG